MEGQSRCSHKYLLLQVWCGLLTVAMVVMAAFLTSIKSKSTEDEVPTLKPDHVSPTFNTLAAPLKSARSSLSYIQLIKSLHDNVWQESPECPSCSLYLGNNSIHCKENSFYLIYAQVTFTKHQSKNPAKSVILRRDATFGKSVMKLVEGTFPSTTEGSVWVAKIVSLTEGDSISLHITDDFLKDSTFWGAYKLQ
ncbi:uncharacterized protein LOC121186180 isoform X2 [Toxotes jaculatrix]|nr:uncharacterized protein LOC121186180 isoform X2 [Toxotes jaculatrix]